MQTDFHHGATYVIGRLSGLSPGQAAIVAYSAQYVDDATNSGTVSFDNGAMYARISSAHKLLDYRNFEELANHQVWLPFHFLPGNGGLPAGHDPPGGFVAKLVCRPDSAVARDMVRACIHGRHAPYGLHRLGITMHVYADTWAHQGFAGVSHQVNRTHHISGPDGHPDTSLSDRLLHFFIGETLPLGHGTVLSHPDKPYLSWSYTDDHGRRIERDNPRDFLAAAEAMSRTIQRYLLGDAGAEVPGLPPRDRELFERMLRELTDEDGDARHRHWLDAIAAGHFSFGGEQAHYIAKGEGSWKHAALGTAAERDDDEDRFAYSPGFLTSDWKLFHDALQTHRLEVLHNILPRYGICAA
jgi:hypothetical protein